MARYVGPVCRLCRRAGEKLFLKGERCYTPKCAVDRRGTPPGQLPQRRRKLSERGLQLREKQKARHGYGVLEGQFRRYFAEAERRTGITADSLLQILETRLDNVVYRLGFADSRNQARQLVRHGHFTLNQRKTDIPSCAVKPGDIIAVVEGSRVLGPFQRLLREPPARDIPSWLSLDREKLTGRMLSLPSPTEIDGKFAAQQVVEYYSR